MTVLKTTSKVASGNGIASIAAVSNASSTPAFLAFLRALAIISGDASIPYTRLADAPLRCDCQSSGTAAYIQNRLAGCDARQIDLLLTKR